MEKLTFYALLVPEELDCIGAYLSKRMSQDVARQRYRYVCIAMEALDQLLMACRSQSINLFVKSFLKMVREVLESDKPNLQILGTNLFVKFANIQEDNPSYHRCYHFFVSRFSDMCHSSNEDPDICFKIRMAGIKVRMTGNDDLQANIWDPELMDKIVPSLLFNLQSRECTQDHSPSLLRMSEKEKSGLVELTECCFRELLRRAAYGKTLISLMDWHDNRSKLLSMSSILDISVLKIKVVKCSRQDNLFMKGHGQQLCQHIYLVCKEQSNGRQHYENLFALFAILSVELANPEVVLDLVRLTVALQDLALSTDEDLPIYNRCAIHSLTAAYFNLICQLTTIPAFCKYIHEVIKVRQVNSPHLLPEGVFTNNPKLPASLENVEGDVLFLQSKISEVLGGGGYNT
ncbi:protein EFR3 homolog B-like [Solea solea]|uniref:protein EFR3 homolog B-like n=1 Tax=Solea solea TaxID=90069 RepID=UPI00272BDC31|nr:protein EFR3 homolog B-like [Solea solea]